MKKDIRGGKPKRPFSFTLGLDRLRSIRTELIIVFLIPVLLIVILGVFSSVSASKSIGALTKQSTVSTMQSSAQYLSAVLVAVDDQASLLARDESVLEYLTTPESNIDRYRQEVTKKFNRVSMTHDEIAGIYMIANNNRNIVSSVATKVGGVTLDSIKSSETYNKVLSGNSMLGWHDDLDTRTGSTPGYYSMSNIKLIKDPDTGDPLGMLVIDMNIDFVNSLFQAVNLGKDSEMHLVSPDGRDISNLSYTGVTDYISGESFFKDIVDGTTRNGDFVRYKNADYMVLHSKVSGTEFLLIGLIPKTILNATSNQIVLSTIILIVLAVAIAVYIAIMMANSMGGTIKSIISVAGQAASGDLRANIESKRRDELGTLTKSINDMIASMRSLVSQMTLVSDNVAGSASEVSLVSKKVSMVSREISSAIQDISQGAFSQATEAEQGVLKINRLAEIINDVSGNAKTIYGLTANTMSLTKRGLNSVNDLDSKTNETTTISRAILDDIKNLEKHSDRIGNIVEVISGIADQTNLLALNAAIEAARAGEAGRGFAVVAEEVRKLAEQAIQATQDISEIIAETRDQTYNTAKRAESTETFLKSQNEAVMDTIKVFENINASMEALSGQMDQIMSNIDEMSENKEQAIAAISNISTVSQETAASSEEVTASTQEQLSGIEELAYSAERLDGSAKELKQTIQKFIV
jgi:methyl-accepting chemotaxis protein